MLPRNTSLLLDVADYKTHVKIKTNERKHELQLKKIKQHCY
jgi:hypothetical protein